MAREISPSEKTWSNLITHILLTQQSYIQYTEDELSWLSTNLLALLTNKIYDLSSDAIYKCLVYLNRSKKFGRYSLIFNMKIQEATSSSDLTMLYNICKEASFPELESLGKLEQDEWNNKIYIEMLCYNLYTDRENLNPSTSSIESKLCSCYEETLSFKSGMKARYISCPTKHIVLLSEYKNDGIVVWPMKEIDLIFLLLSKGDNPYTETPLPDRIKEVIKAKYSDILQICKKAYSLGYQHEYDL